MPMPRFEVPVGAIDGSNRVFKVSVSYLPGRTAVWLNGIKVRKDLEDGWIESNPGIGEVTLNEAPRPQFTPDGSCPDVLEIFFIDTSPVLPESVIERLKGRFQAASDLSGRLFGSGLLQAALDETGGLSGRLASTPIRGRIEGPDRLYGRVSMVC